MYGVQVKPGVMFNPIAPAGFRLLSAIDVTARRLKLVLTITCGSDSHPANDPHSSGEAYDLRTHGLTDDQKRGVLRELMLELSDDSTADPPTIASGGLGTHHFWGWVENPGQPTEHIHVQRRNNTTYPLMPPSAPLAA